jgi:hypothetical protein
VQVAFKFAEFVEERAMRLQIERGMAMKNSGRLLVGPGLCSERQRWADDGEGQRD